MYELVYVTLWLIGAAFLAIHAFWKKGGVISSGTMLTIFIGLYYPSTNVQVESGGQFIASSNPIAGWIALLLSIISFIILMLCVFGIWGEDDDEEEKDHIATDTPDVMKNITGRM